MKISFSITDLSPFLTVDRQFEIAKELGFDGVEVFAGFKTRFVQKRLLDLSRKFSIPILSVHQPAWAFLGMYLDEGSIAMAQKFGAGYNAHPFLFNTPLVSAKAKNYFVWLSQMSKKYNTRIFLENMPCDHALPFLEQAIFRPHVSSTNLKNIAEVCYEYNFGHTLDTSHLCVEHPFSLAEFPDIQDYMENIHLSDFTPNRQHLELGKGLLDLTSFCKTLKKIKYRGFITLEISLSVFMSQTAYYASLQNSLLLLRKNLK